MQIVNIPLKCTSKIALRSVSTTRNSPSIRYTGTSDHKAQCHFFFKSPGSVAYSAENGIVPYFPKVGIIIKNIDLEDW